MLKLFLVIGIAYAALYVLFQFILPFLAAVAMVLLDAFQGDRSGIDMPPPDIPPPDEAAYGALQRAAMAFTTQPYVTVFAEVSGDPDGRVLTRTASDAYGTRRYVETQRRVGKTLHNVLCVYVKGKLKAVACMETPVSQVRWDAYFAGLEDLRENGAFLSYVDHLGRRRETRLSEGRKHHA
jgi:hypothetical protein